MPDRRHRDDEDFDDDDRPRRGRRDEPDDDDRPRGRRRPDDDDEPSHRRGRDDRDYEDDDPRPRRRSRDQFEDDYDDEPEHRRERASPQKLRAVAVRQKILILCILAYVISAIAIVFVPVEIRPFVAIPGAIVSLAAAVFVLLLAIEVHGTGLGIVFGLLTLLPCIGLIVLLIVNQTATSMLQRNRIRVGLLGANMSDLP